MRSSWQLHVEWTASILFDPKFNIQNAAMLRLIRDALSIVFVLSVLTASDENARGWKEEGNEAHLVSTYEAVKSNYALKDVVDRENLMQIADISEDGDDESRWEEEGYPQYLASSSKLIVPLNHATKGKSDKETLLNMIDSTASTDDDNDDDGHDGEMSGVWSGFVGTFHDVNQTRKCDQVSRDGNYRDLQAELGEKDHTGQQLCCLVYVDCKYETKMFT